MKTEDLQAQGLTPEQIKFVMAENGKDINGLKTAQSDLIKAEADRDKFKSDYEAAKATLDGFEGKDFEAITKERDIWKEKAEDSEKDYKRQLHDRDYADAIKEHVDGLTFTSESAKKAYVIDLKAADLTMKEGKIFGLTDFQNTYMESDPSAFVTQEQQQQQNNKAKFTTPPGKNQQPGAKPTPEQLMKMKNENPGLDISQYI